MDDFCKSLGKQMNLVLYRMEDTERIRYKLRERRRQEIREKAAKEEEMEKKQMERIERNRKWRERKYGKDDSLESDGGKGLDEKEERKQKNKEWRERRMNPKPCNDLAEYQKKSHQGTTLETDLLPELECPYCQAEMSPPTKIYQCLEGHNLCQKCKSLRNMKVSRKQKDHKSFKIQSITHFPPWHRSVPFVKESFRAGTLQWRK